VGRHAPHEAREVTDDSQDGERLLRSLMDSHGGAVRVIVARYEHDRAEAEEVWSDVFQLAYERIMDVARLPEGHQRSWLLRTARYLIANRGRRNATRRRTLDQLRRQPLPMAPSAEDDFVSFVEDEEARRTSDVVRTALLGMRFEHRQILILHALGNNGPSIARQLGITKEAARKRLMTARIEFRRLHPEPVQRHTERSDG
jgi:RNA polymerase sigma factor (sigma-70 family)